MPGKLPWAALSISSRHGPSEQWVFTLGAPVFPPHIVLHTFKSVPNILVYEIKSLLLLLYKELVRPAGSSSWSIQLVRPAGPTCRPIYTLHLTHSILHNAHSFLHIAS